MSVSGSRSLSPGTIGGLFLGPALIYILLIVIYPLAYSLWASFTDLRLTRPVHNFVGLQTYASALQDEGFLHSLAITVAFLVAAILIEFVLGMILALSFNAMRRKHAAMRALLLLPVMATPVTVGLIWKLMLNSDFGIINHLTSAAGLGQIMWLSDPAWALVSILIMDVWNWTPFMFLVLLAGLQGLPAEPFESAAVDGASPTYAFFHLTLPMMRRVIVIALVFRLMFALATFDTVFVLTKGGPALATDLITLFIYREGFVNLNISYASAVSFLLLIGVLVVVVAGFRRSLAQ